MERHRHRDRSPLMRVLLVLLVSVYCLLSIHAQDADVFRVVHSVDEVVTTVERARHVSAVLLVSSKSDPKLSDLEAENDGQGNDDAMVKALDAQFPHVRKIAQSLDGAVEFVIADIADPKAALKKWNIASLPALVIYKDAPKKNPYTSKMYRDATLVPVAVLTKPRELKKLLRESVPSTYVAEWSTLGGVTTLQDVQTQRKEKEKDTALVVLVSKQTTASPLFRALSVEFASRGLAFAYAHNEESVVQELIEKWAIETLPAIVVVTSKDTFDDRVVFQNDPKMKSYADLKALLEPFAFQETEEATDFAAGDKTTSSSAALPLLTAENFDDHVLQSKLVWIVSFMDAETEARTGKKEWKKIMSGIQKKSGIVAVGAVSCAKDLPLCEQYGGASVVRIFPIRQHATTGEIERAELVDAIFKTVEDAAPPAIASLPDVVAIMGSAAEVNAFISRALALKAMPVLLVTSKMETPPILKSLALSFPTQNVAVGVVSDLDPQVKQMFNLPASAKSSFLALIAVDKQKAQQQEDAQNQPLNAAPFGVILYDKKAMGPFTYPNMVRYLLSVLTQYPHPKPLASDDDDQGGDAALASSDDRAAAEIDVPYVQADNLETLCSGTKICAIGFFEGHADTLRVDDSPLSKSIGVLRNVAAAARKARQPFHFMWTNGKCHSAFAESFGVGAFQMPTVVVYSPSKARSATNIGVFDEANTMGFLKGVLSGKIATAPLAHVGALRGECTVDELSDGSAGADGVALDDEGDDDLGDLLSEILGDEEQQRRQLQDELAKERKADKKNKDTMKKDKNKKKKKKKKSKKKATENDRDEL